MLILWSQCDFYLCTRSGMIGSAFSREEISTYLQSSVLNLINTEDFHIKNLFVLLWLINKARSFCCDVK